MAIRQYIIYDFMTISLSLSLSLSLFTVYAIIKKMLFSLSLSLSQLSLIHTVLNTTKKKCYFLLSLSLFSLSYSLSLALTVYNSLKNPFLSLSL